MRVAFLLGLTLAGAAIVADRIRSALVVRVAHQPPPDMSEDDTHVGEVNDPDGRVVVLLARIWEGKIAHDHPELTGQLEQVLGTVSTPDHIEPDPQAGRRRYYRRGAGPSNWLLVVVSFEQEPGRIITALAIRRDPKRWKP